MTTETPSPKYPTAQRSIAARARFVYGSANYFARQIGITRQALRSRSLLAAESTSTHAWFEFVLALPAGSLVAGVTEEDMTRPVAPSEVAYLLGASATAWKARGVRPRTRNGGA